MEIERKIILNSLPEGEPIYHSEVEQFYISFNPEVRLRKDLNNSVPFRLTVKNEGTLCREEIETPVTEEFYQKMEKFINKKPIHKDYYIYEIDGQKVEISIVDHGVYIYGEVEFDNIEDAKFYVWPLEGYDVTEDPCYKMNVYWKATRENN